MYYPPGDSPRTSTNGEEGCRWPDSIQRYDSDQMGPPPHRPRISCRKVIRFPPSSTSAIIWNEIRRASRIGENGPFLTVCKYKMAFLKEMNCGKFLEFNLGVVLSFDRLCFQNGNGVWNSKIYIKFCENVSLLGSNLGRIRKYS